jgi:6-phospho-beta-glucosidase
MEFREDFLWGSASAAYQIEGAYNIDFKGPSIWDSWSHLYGKTFEGTNGDIACDHYNRYMEDISLMSEMGLKTYRFSISWSRILPDGVGEINQKGIEFYNSLINELIKNNIEPMVTLYHWDLPLSLQEKYQGWLSEDIVDDFVNYCEICFSNFYDRVKYWIVINEPNIFTSLGYLYGLHPPGDFDMGLYLKAFHNTVLAHSKTVIKYKEKRYKGYIGSSIAFTPSYSVSDSENDLHAKEMYDSLNSYWHLDSYYKGVYPEKGLDYYKSIGIMPYIADKDMEIMKMAASLCDFIGINYYQSVTIGYNPLDGIGFSQMNTSGKKGTQLESGIPGLYKSFRNEKLRYTDWDWVIDPDGLEYALNTLKNRYNLPIIISENGLGAFDSINEDGHIDDDYRIEFIKEHIQAIKKAKSNGVEVIAYCTWSFTDLLSWLNGYKKRYGFVHIDFESGSLKRTKKKSFNWYKNVIETNGKGL